MDKYGLLTIKFSSPIQIPSYLLRELDQKNPSKSGGRRLQNFQTDIFWRSSDYKQNINANWSSKKHASLQVSGYQINTEDTNIAAPIVKQEVEIDQNTEFLDQLTQTIDQHQEVVIKEKILSKLQEEIYKEESEKIFQENDDLKESSRECSDFEYFSEEKQSCVELQFFFGTLQDLFKLSFQPAQDGSIVSMTYNVVSLTQDEMKVQLHFSDPLEVMPSDKLKIQIGLATLKSEETEQMKFTQPCVRQIVKNMATKAMDAVGNMSTAATAATVIGSAVLQTLVSGCLAQIWGMINGMQFIIHLPCLNVEFPQSAFEVIKKILMVATFDIPYLNMETVKKVYKLPEEDSIFDHPDQNNIRSNFEQLGYASKQMSNNLGSVFVIVLVTTFSLLIILLLEPFKHPFVQKVNMKLKQKFLWNFVIRLVIETYLELGFSVYFNLRYARCQFSYLGSWVNYFYAVGFAAILVAAPIFIIIFYSRNFERFKDEDFESKFGSVYEGLKTKDRSVIAYTTVFLMRRALFTVISVVFYQYVMIQLGLAVVIQLASGCYIILFKPFNETLINRLEVMNDVITLLLIDLIFLFTPLLDSQVLKYKLGFAFICMLAGCICVHLFFLFSDITKQLIEKIKVWREKWKARQAQKQETALDSNQNKQLIELVLKSDRQVIAKTRAARKITQRRKINPDKEVQQTVLQSIQEIEEPMSSRAIEADNEDQQPERILPNRSRRKRLILPSDDQDQSSGNILLAKSLTEKTLNSIQPELSWIEKEKQRIRCQHFLLREVVYPVEWQQKTPIIEVDIPSIQQESKPAERQFEGKRPSNPTSRELFDLL